MKNRCVFLDRDGVINKERGEYTYLIKDFILCDGVRESVKLLKAKGFIVIVITNQAGISKGIYTRADMMNCHEYLISEVKEIEAIYYSPYHPNQTESLSRKPDSLLFEKAMARYDINPENSWMVGDRERDLIPAKKFNMQTVLIGEDVTVYADFNTLNLSSAVKDIILAE